MYARRPSRDEKIEDYTVSERDISCATRRPSTASDVERSPARLVGHHPTRISRYTCSPHQVAIDLRQEYGTRA